ncbi:MAG: rod shape-determining protein MreD, partial [Thermaurantiacus sp.]
MSRPSLRSRPMPERSRVSLPALTVLAAAFLITLPIPLGWNVMPHLPMLLVLLWASVQPRLMPAWLAFLLGIAVDALTGAPVGLNGMLFLLLVVAIRIGEGRPEGQGFALGWAGASLLVVAAFLLSWQIQLLLLRPVPIAPHAVQALLTCFAFPAMLRL